MSSKPKAPPAPATLEEWESRPKNIRGYKNANRRSGRPASARRMRAFRITGNCSRAINDAGIRSAMPPSEVIESLFTTHAEAVKAILSKS